MRNLALFVLFGLMLSGCTTTARFIIPEGTDLMVNGKTAERDGQGVTLTTHPFSWAAYHGVDYQLVNKNGYVGSGKLRTRFRAVSIFWPPYGILYWPKGFAYDCYNLTGITAEECAPTTPEERKLREKRAAQEEAKRRTRAAKRETIGTRIETIP